MDSYWLGRFVPTLNVQELTLSVKNIVFIGFMVIYAGFLVAHITADLGGLAGISRQFAGLFR